MYKPRIIRVILVENPSFIIATVYYAGNTRRTYRCKLDGESHPLPKTVRNFMHSPDVGVSYRDRSNAYIPWRAWTYAKIR